MIKELLYGEYANGWVVERTPVAIYDRKIQDCKEGNRENTIGRRNPGKRESRSGRGHSMEEFVRLRDVRS